MITYVLTYFLLCVKVIGIWQLKNNVLYSSFVFEKFKKKLVVRRCSLLQLVLKLGWRNALLPLQACAVVHVT